MSKACRMLLLPVLFAVGCSKSDQPLYMDPPRDTAAEKAAFEEVVRAELELHEKMGAAAVSHLASAVKMTLFVLGDDNDNEASEEKQTFHGWPVARTVNIDDRETLQAITHQLKLSLESEPGFSSDPIEPDFGIQVSRDGAPVDFIVSFTSRRIKWFVADEEPQEMVMGMNDHSPDEYFGQLLGITYPE